jgi:predicted DNA-binding protein YlxM (UPF0122 family)
VKSKTVTHKKGGKGKRRPLRGQALIKKARETLKDWAKQPLETHPINISRLAKKLNVTRQAIYDNGLAEEIKECKKLQLKNFSQNEAGQSAKSAEARIADKDKKLADMQSKLDGWIELWATVEYNARMHGIDADKIFAPMALPDREIVRTLRRNDNED